VFFHILFFLKDKLRPDPHNSDCLNQDKPINRLNCCHSQDQGKALFILFASGERGLSREGKKGSSRRGEMGRSRTRTGQELDIDQDQELIANFVKDNDQDNTELYRDKYGLGRGRSHRPRPRPRPRPSPRLREARGLGHRQPVEVRSLRVASGSAHSSTGGGDRCCPMTNTCACRCALSWARARQATTTTIETPPCPPKGGIDGHENLTKIKAR